MSAFGHTRTFGRNRESICSNRRRLLETDKGVREPEPLDRTRDLFQLLSGVSLCVIRVRPKPTDVSIFNLCCHSAHPFRVARARCARADKVRNKEELYKNMLRTSIAKMGACYRKNAEDIPRKDLIEDARKNFTVVRFAVPCLGSGESLQAQSNLPDSAAREIP